jgi:DNA-directed RNA polymerase beta' subunit
MLEWPDDCVFPSAEVEAVARRPFTTHECWRLLRDVPESFRRDVLHLPAPLPDTFVWCSMLVSPNFIRPSISIRGSNSEEDLTRSTQDIYKWTALLQVRIDECAEAEAAGPEGAALRAAEAAEATATLRKPKPTPAVLKRRAVKALQKSVNVLVDKDITASGRSQPMKQAVGHNKLRRSVTARFTGKKGTVRGNLMAKRVGRCGRAVAGPHVSCDVEQVGIPKRLAIKIPVTVGLIPRNWDDLMACVRVGANRIGGALYIDHADGTSTNLVNVRPEDAELIVQKCRIGDQVSRMLRDGDLAMYNRQPTLHPLGIVSGPAFLHDGSTIVTRTELEGPMNGDYDGDEKNFHVPQGEHARAEMKILTAIKHNAIDHSCSAPSYVPVQDSMCAIHLLTHPGRRIPRSLAFQMYMELRYARKTACEAFGMRNFMDEDDDVDGDVDDTVAATTIISALLRDDFNYSHAGVKIRRGFFACDSAAILKKHVSGSRSILHLIGLDYGEPEIVEFVSDLGRATRIFMRDYWGFSVGFSDILLEPTVIQELKRDIADIVEEANGHTNEQDQMRVLAQLSEAAQAALDRSTVYARSNLRIMIECGAKGKATNFLQIAGCIGQQIVGANRPQPDETNRTLSCFRPGDTRAAAHGLCVSSFIDGMSPSENSFHARGAREGVTETQCGTSKSGYLQRRLHKGTENAQIVHDVHGISVRNEKGAVVMLFYFDGFGTKFVEPCTLKDIATPVDWPAAVLAEPQFVQWRTTIERTRQELHRARQMCSAASRPNTEFMLPLNARRWLDNFDQFDRSDSFDPQAIAAAIAALHDSIDALPTQFHVLAALKYHFGSVLLALWAQQTLRSVSTVTALWAALERRIYRAAAEAGCPAGTLAASADDKNITQATLNSFHHIGEGSSETKTGIDHVKELVEASQTALARVRVRARAAAINMNRAVLEEAARTLRSVHLRDLVVLVSVVGPEETAANQTQIQTAAPLLWLQKAGTVADSSRSVVFSLDRMRLGATRSTATELTRALHSLITVPFRFSPFHVAGPLTLTVWFATASFSEPEVHMRSIALLDLLLAGYEQVLAAEVFPCMSGAPGFEIRATCCALAKNKQASGLRPFFQNESFFDVENMFCSNLAMVQTVYGVEAALLTLFREIYGTVCNSGFVHSHHIYLLCVIICITGKPLAMTRHGLKAKGCDVLQQASFEQPRAVFAAGSLHGDASINVRRCLSSSTIVGCRAGVGTGMVEARCTPEYRALWDAAKEKAVCALQDDRCAATEAGEIGDAVRQSDTLSLCRRVRDLPQALRPTQMWGLDEAVPKLVRDFRDFAIEWLSLHPAQAAVHAVRLEEGGNRSMQRLGPAERQHFEHTKHSTSSNHSNHPKSLKKSAAASKRVVFSDEVCSIEATATNAEHEKKASQRLAAQTRKRKRAQRPTVQHSSKSSNSSSSSSNIQTSHTAQHPQQQQRPSLFRTDIVCDALEKTPNLFAT